MADVVIRPYRPGDETEINQLFNNVFGAARSSDEWHWKFMQNPLQAPITVAECAGRIVGQYAVVPRLFSYLGKAVLAAMPVDNFVHPDFRGSIDGVQKALHKFQCQLWAGAFGFGFPTHRHYVLGKRFLKYQDVGDLPVVYRRLNLRLAVRRRFPRMPSVVVEAIRKASNFAYRASFAVRKLIGASATRTTLVESFDARVDKLWEHARKKHKIICAREHRFLAWRYGKPKAAYQIVIAEKGDELVGYAVMNVKNESGVLAGHIVDLLTDDSPGVDAALVIRAVREMLSRNVDYALCWMLPDSSVFQTLRRLGFARRDEMFPPVHVVFQCFEPQTVDVNVLKDPRNWYLTMGDSDTF